MARLDTEKTIRSILCRVACLDGEYSPTADLFGDLGVRSIAALNLLLALEDEFAISIADSAFRSARSVRQIASLVETLAAAPTPQAGACNG